MRLMSSGADRARVLTGPLCVLLLACMAGCASKNPLIDEPAAPVAQAPAAPKAEPAAPAAQPAAAPQAAAPAESGVQTTKERRLLGFLSPYRIDIQQGNFVSKEMVSQLKPGMTRDQVIFALGTPLLTDLFHANRWDYVFRMKKGNGEITSSRVTVFFKDNRLERFVGGDLPTEEEYITRISGAAPVPKAAAPAAPQTAPSSASEPK